ncbi:hypothetical protein ACIP2Z_33710 [Streptomyces iakyrus]|uniref:Uncharacterized protein n=1 Tax=Streptomyces iakyrus TaxID=68219 RepID=A0ABW8FP83_9ACTN
MERDAASKAQDVPDWDKADALERAVRSRNELERRWHDEDTDIDDETFFRNLPVLERRIKELRADQRAHEALKAEAEEAKEDVRNVGVEDAHAEARGDQEGLERRDRSTGWQGQQDI